MAPAWVFHNAHSRQANAGKARRGCPLRRIMGQSAGEILIEHGRLGWTLPDKPAGARPVSGSGISPPGLGLIRSPGCGRSGSHWQAACASQRSVAMAVATWAGHVSVAVSAVARRKSASQAGRRAPGYGTWPYNALQIFDEYFPPELIFAPGTKLSLKSPQGTRAQPNRHRSARAG